MREPEEEKAYGLIIEWKDEGPLIMESKLMTFAEASNAMKSQIGFHRVIRICIFRAECRRGHEGLLPPKETE